MPVPGWGMAMTAGQSHRNGQTAATGPDANRRNGMLSGTRIDEEATEKIGTVIRRRPAERFGPEPPSAPSRRRPRERQVRGRLPGDIHRVQGEPGRPGPSLDRGTAWQDRPGPLGDGDARPGHNVMGARLEMGQLPERTGGEWTRLSSSQQREHSPGEGRRQGADIPARRTCGGP